MELSITVPVILSEAKACPERSRRGPLASLRRQRPVDGFLPLPFDPRLGVLIPACEGFRSDSAFCIPTDPTQNPLFHKCANNCSSPSNTPSNPVPRPSAFGMEFASTPW
jgi:hypothetical protein